MTTRSSGYRHYSGLAGSNQVAVGLDPDIYIYQDIQSALDDVPIGGTVLVAPGTYTVTTAIDWSKPCTIKSLGNPGDVVITSALATRTVKINMPATGAAAAQYFKAYGIKFDNTSTGNALDTDNNGGLAQAQYIQLHSCGFTSTSGVALNVAQSTNSINVFVTVAGNPWLNDMGASTVTLTKAGSVCTIYGMNCTGALTVGTTALASIINYQHNFYYSQAQTTGGGAGQLHNMIGNTYFTASAGASVATGGVSTDFDATATLFFATHAITPT